MATYTCAMYPSLTIAGICQFTHGVFETTDPQVIEAIEQSDSFKFGYVREHVPDADEVAPLPEKGDVVKMKKAQLETFIEDYGLEAPAGARRNELVRIVLEFVEEASSEEE